MTLDDEFAAFWKIYPRRVGKLAALKAYQKARHYASAEEIAQGVENYNAHLPDEMQFIAHPASWLNAGRWSDEYDRSVRPQRIYWADECAEMHGGLCDKQWTHEMRKREAAS